MLNLKYIKLIAYCFIFAFPAQALFAEDPVADEIPIVKEELRMEMAPPAAGEAEKPSAKFSLNMGTPARPETLKVKKAFRPEVGLVEVAQAQAPSGTTGALTIKNCVDIAVKNHLPLQIAEKNVALAKMRVWEARRNMLPTVTLAYEDSNGEVDDRQYSGKKRYIEGQQPVYHGGELYYTLKQAETNLEVVKNDYSRIRNDLVLQVKKAYFTLAKAKENLNIQHTLAQEVEKLSDSVSKQFEASVTTKLELLNVTSQASQVSYQLLSAEGDVSVAELILKQAMNLDPKDPIAIESGTEFRTVSVDFETVLNAALLNRPEMRINSLMIEYYNYGKKIAKAKGLLKVDILGQWGYAKEEFESRDRGTDDLNSRLEQQWYAGVKASMPLWGSTAEYSYTREQWQPVVSTVHGTEALTNAAKLKLFDKLDYYSDKQLAEIDFFKARQEMIKARQDITLEAREGCFNYEKALRQFETASNKVKYQEKDLEFMKMKRGLEEAQDSNVIESMIKLAQEKFGYLQSLADCQTSLAAIDKAVGVEDYFSTQQENDKT